MTPPGMTQIETMIGMVLRVCAVILLSAILVLMVANVANRFVNFAGLDWNDEIIELMLVWMIFLSAAEVWRVNQHFAVDILPTTLAGTSFGKPLKILISVGSLAFIAVFTHRSYELFQRATDVSPYFSLPRKLWYGAMPLCGVLMLGFSLRQLVTIVVRPSESGGKPQHTAAELGPHTLPE